jgi:hypothetical protein
VNPVGADNQVIEIVGGVAETDVHPVALLAHPLHR